MARRIGKRIYISGRVQGVGFRYSAMVRARELGLTGWVKNCADGRVEASVFGDESAVREMIEWCHLGPPMSRVLSVEVIDETAPSQEGKFTAY